MSEMPRWNPPEDIEQALEDGDGVWEDERWSPILVTVMSGTEYQGREIPVLWQIEFDPFEEEFETASARLEDVGVEPDGYGWGEYIRQTVQGSSPKLAERMNITDCEASTCVIWVESAEDCRDLLMAVWGIAFAE